LFGRLLVLASNGKNKQGAVVWLCQCKCGKHTNVRTALLTSGHTQSCGCLGVENRLAAVLKALTKHGRSKTRTHNVWGKMRQRCENPRDKSYPRYGGRGIKVCKRWQSFENFLADMGEPPSPVYSIDRINNDGHYEPGNCRWATNKQQCNNTRFNVSLSHNGETKTISQWAEYTGINPGTLYSRIQRGWAIEKALVKHDYRR
jgi:hypothetical protein